MLQTINTYRLQLLLTVNILNTFGFSFQNVLYLYLVFYFLYIIKSTEIKQSKYSDVCLVASNLS